MPRFPTPSPYGTHRVIEPAGVLPQPAWRLDNTMAPADNEILVDVATLNVDAASFTRLRQASGGEAASALSTPESACLAQTDGGRP